MAAVPASAKVEIFSVCLVIARLAQKFPPKFGFTQKTADPPVPMKHTGKASGTRRVNEALDYYNAEISSREKSTVAAELRISGRTASNSEIEERTWEQELQASSIRSSIEQLRAEIDRSVRLVERFQNSLDALP